MGNAKSNNVPPVPFEKPIWVTRPFLPPLEEFILELEKVWNTHWLTNNGPLHRLLESEIAEYLEVRHVSLFCNGTVGLLACCKALGLSGEVITTPFTFPATPHVLSWTNITPVFCDIDPITLNIDPQRIEALITKKTSAILGVHVYGAPCDVESIQRIAHRYNLKIIYDAAHAFGVKVNGKSIASYGDLSMFSFHATKLYHTAEGGAITVNDEEIRSRIELLKNFGIAGEEDVLDIGINGKMNEIQAALGIVNLRYIADEMKKRERLVKIYQERLKDVRGINFRKTRKDVTETFQYFVIRINENAFGMSRDKVYENFKNYNVYTRKYFYPLCSTYPIYKNLPSAAPDQLPVATEAAQEVLAMPLYGDIQPDEVEKICDILRYMSKN